jgi:hypothetical protein
MDSAEYKPSEIEKKFKVYYDKLIWETLHARTHLKLWEQLEKYRSNYLKELNQAPHFFQFTAKAHLDDCLLILARVLGKNAESLSIWEFLNFIELNLDIFSNASYSKRVASRLYNENLTTSHIPITMIELSKDRTKLNNLESIVKNLKTRRDKTLAHIDLKFISQKKTINKDFPLQSEQIQSVIDIVFEILNRYSSSFESSIFSKEFLGENDLQYVMDALRFRIETRKQENKALIESMKNKRNI